jgi:cellulose synthase/poly-beta-1,6-N-acetylglucosamine synthase-like glycosyltransferase
MKKPSNKQAKKASKLAKAENLKNKANKIITVKNAEGDPDTTAEIVIQNKIDYEPKVSVIIPVYNVEQYLRESLHPLNVVSGFNASEFHNRT